MKFLIYPRLSFNNTFLETNFHFMRINWIISRAKIYSCLTIYTFAHLYAYMQASIFIRYISF